MIGGAKQREGQALVGLGQIFRVKLVVGEAFLAVVEDLLVEPVLSVCLSVCRTVRVNDCDAPMAFVRPATLPIARAVEADEERADVPSMG